MTILSNHIAVLWKLNKSFIRYITDRGSYACWAPRPIWSNIASDSSMCADCELLTQCDDTGRGQWYFRNSRLGHKEDGEVKALWSDFANRRLMTSLFGGVEDKYEQYINYRNEVFNMLREDWVFRRGDIYLVELEPRIQNVISSI